LYWYKLQEIGGPKSIKFEGCFSIFGLGNVFLFCAATFLPLVFFSKSTGDCFFRRMMAILFELFLSLFLFTLSECLLVFQGTWSLIILRGFISLYFPMVTFFDKEENEINCSTLSPEQIIWWNEGLSGLFFDLGVT